MCVVVEIAYCGTTNTTPPGSYLSCLFAFLSFANSELCLGTGFTQKCTFCSVQTKHIVGFLTHITLVLNCTGALQRSSWDSCPEWTH